MCLFCNTSALANSLADDDNLCVFSSLGYNRHLELKVPNSHGYGDPSYRTTTDTGRTG